jgi:hypothetical protein
MFSWGTVDSNTRKTSFRNLRAKILKLKASRLSPFCHHICFIVILGERMERTSTITELLNWKSYAWFESTLPHEDMQNNTQSLRCIAGLTWSEDILERLRQQVSHTFSDQDWVIQISIGVIIVWHFIRSWATLFWYWRLRIWSTASWGATRWLWRLGWDCLWRWWLTVHGEIRKVKNCNQVSRYNAQTGKSCIMAVEKRITSI